MFKWVKRTKNNTPNFGEIDSRQKAVELYEKGYLAKMYLFLLQFGGQDETINIW